jgi:hypothetical protein
MRQSRRRRKSEYQFLELVTLIEVPIPGSTLRRCTMKWRKGTTTPCSSSSWRRLDLQYAPYIEPLCYRCLLAGFQEEELVNKGKTKENVEREIHALYNRVFEGPSECKASSHSSLTRLIQNEYLSVPRRGQTGI